MEISSLLKTLKKKYSVLFMMPKVYHVVFLVVTSYVHTICKSGIKLSEHKTILFFLLLLF